MPMHDWTRVSAGTYHAFHNSWITHLQEALNAGILPPTCYALGEQRSGDIGPDVLALHVDEDELQPQESSHSFADDDRGLIAVAESPPRVRLAQEAEADVNFLLHKQRRIVIRHSSGDRIVALIEILSPANKHSEATLNDFIDKVVAALRDGIHVLLIDPFPPGSHDPHGIHGAVWERLLAGRFTAPADLPLTLVSYFAKSPVTAYVEPLAVGRPLSDMPLFLTTTHYVLVPLETTYSQSWNGVPERWRRVIVEPTAAREPG